jgi:putative ABC transport system permease protein
MRLEVLRSEALQQWMTVEIVGIVSDFRSVPFFATTAAGSDFDNEFQSKGKFFTYKNGLFKEFHSERLSIKLKPGSLGNTIASLQRAYNETFPATPFNWFFLEDHMNKVYSNEKITRNQIVLFVILAVVIACLGFQGMIAHKVTSKTKEIGIRKILGAGMAHIAKEILKPSSIQFGVAVVLGVPIAWYLGNSYLQKFSERILLQWWHYAILLTLLMFIMIVTVATLLWKAAKSNPVEALKHD